MTNVIENDAKDLDSEFLMYSAGFCPYCIAAKRFFESNGFKFKEINLTNNHEKRNLIIEQTGHRTVPVIFDLRENKIRFVGGFDDLIAEQS